MVEKGATAKESVPRSSKAPSRDVAMDGPSDDGQNKYYIQPLLRLFKKF